MVDIVLIAQAREKLTLQTLNSLFQNTDPNSYNLTFVNDGGRHWDRTPDWPEETVTVQLQPSKGIVGLVRNIGADFARRYWGRGEWLLFLDNDIFVHPGWLELMVSVAGAYSDCKILGGARHPFHQPNAVIDFLINQTAHYIEETDAVAGYSMLMSWETFEKYGPFDQHAKGLGQSEDFAICQKVIKDGFRVGYVSPPVLTVTGLTNTLGEKVPGWEQLRDMVPEGVVAE